MKFIRDLRRRHVFRLAGIYIVGAWVVVQVADQLFQAWGLPDAAMQFVFIGAALCFPIALAFGWIFDITSEGIVRTKPAGDDEPVNMRLQKSDYAILAALAIVGAVIIFGSAERIQEEMDAMQTTPAGIERRANSIAVLPFSNLDINVQTGYFSDGITEEILQRLSAQSALHVMSSGSSFSFRDSDKTPAQLSEMLGVGYVLDGSIRRSENRVRVSARLLDAAGFQVWTDAYDRELTEIFAVQTEIANAVAQQIVREIVPLEALPEGRTTDNMEAYTAYLLGRFEADRRALGWKERAEESFNKAIELDPDFAPAYAGLAILVVNSGFGPHWAEAQKTASRSLELDPELAEAHAIYGLITTILGDVDTGVESLHRAIELNPSYSSSYAWLSFALDRQGRSTESINALYRGLDRDPFNPILVANLADREEMKGNFENAEQLLLRLIELPHISGPSMDILELYRDWGRYPEELATSKKVMLKMGQDSAGYLPHLARNYAVLGMTKEAEYWLERSRAENPDSDFQVADVYFVAKLFDDRSILHNYLNAAQDPGTIEDDFVRAALLSYGGLAHIQAGNTEKGIDWLEEGLKIYRMDFESGDAANGIDVNLYDQEWPTWLVVYVFQRLAFAYQKVERFDDADHLLGPLDSLLADMEPTTPAQFEWLALQRGLNGNIDEAYAALNEGFKLGWANYQEVVNDPAWASIIENPGVRNLLTEAKSRLDSQRERVQESEETEDFRMVFDALMTNQAGRSFD